MIYDPMKSMNSESERRTEEEAYCTARNERISSNKKINLSFYIKAVFLLSDAISKTIVDGKLHCKWSRSKKC